MELRALRYFVTVAEERHFGRAAERLHIVQPAVSQQVARLERDLGIVLLDRSPRHVRLTAAGERVLVAARDALAAAERVRVAAGDPCATLRIGTAPALTTRLERAIDVLRADNPALEAVLVDLPAGARLDAVREGRLDLALIRGAVAAPGVTVRAAWAEPLHAVVAIDHHLAGCAGVRLPDLVDGRLRVLDEEADPPVHAAVEQALREGGVCPARGRTSGSVQDLVVAVGADPGAWALLPAEQVAAVGSLRVRSIPLGPPRDVVGSVIAPSVTAPHCVDALAAAFADA